MNPWLDWTRIEQKPQSISVICDLSESMFNHLDDNPLQYDETQKKIKSWGEKHNLRLNFFQLGRQITKLANIESSNLTTDFRDIPNFISFYRPQHLLLITDGKATVGKNINEIEFNQLCPIHTVGVGPIQIDQDIEIQDVILPDLLVRGDTIDLKIRIKTHIHKNIQSDFKIINVFGNEIYHESMLFEKGDHLKDLILTIPTDVISGVNLASINPMIGEKNIKNNTFSFRGNLQESINDIMLISGALSSNSRMIEWLLNDFENANIHHFFRMDRKRWNAEPFEIVYSNLKMIVLDDFPMYNEDGQLFQKIVELSKEHNLPVVYLEGPWGNLTAGEMIHSEYPYFVPKVVDSSLMMDISTQSSWLETSIIDLDQLPPQKRSIKWIVKEKPWLAYKDASMVIGNKNNFYLVSLPALSESYFKLSMISQSIISKIINKVFLNAFHGSEGLLKFVVDRKFLNKGEMIQISLDLIDEIDLMDLAIYSIHDADTVQLECSDNGLYENILCSTILLKPGEYTFYAQASLISGEQIYSNTKLSIVQDVNIEMKELIQERQALMEISYKTGGTYASIDSLDTILAQIDITPVQFLKYYQISSLSSQNYWWILILLLSIEWYFRKKIGLL